MTTWIERELNLDAAAAAAVIERLADCRDCFFYDRRACRLAAPGPNARYRHASRLLNGPCTDYLPARTTVNLFTLCADCAHLRPHNQCAAFQAGCDALQRRLAVLAAGRCRHHRPRPTLPPGQRGLAPPYPADTFITLADLAADTQALARAIPWHAIDAVIGVARSGMIPAAILATLAHKPLLALSPVARRMTPLGSGFRLADAGHSPRAPLLVDDSLASGHSLARAREILAAHAPHAVVTTAVIYADPNAATAADWVARLYPLPHYFEWCFTNTAYSDRLAYDIDGILCDDPPAIDTDPAYRRWIDTATPKYLPKRRPAILLSARTEQWRDATLQWLARHEVAAARLILWDQEPDARWTTPDTVARWKADQLRQLRALGITGYVESDPRQAEIIARLADMPVLCPAAARRFGPHHDHISTT